MEKYAIIVASKKDEAEPYEYLLNQINYITEIVNSADAQETIRSRLAAMEKNASNSSRLVVLVTCAVEDDMSCCAALKLGPIDPRVKMVVMQQPPHCVYAAGSNADHIKANQVNDMLKLLD